MIGDMILKESMQNVDVQALIFNNVLEETNSVEKKKKTFKLSLILKLSSETRICVTAESTSLTL